MSRYDLTHRAAIVAELIKALHQANSWCGETHIQKAVYLLQNFGKINMGYEFVLYKHGPYSFDLATDMASLRGANIVEFVFPVRGYGPSVQLTKIAPHVFHGSTQFVEPLLPIINFIESWLGPHDVRYLERVATAYFVRQLNPEEEPTALAAKIRQLKPHISEHDSLRAVQQIDEKIATMVAI